MSTECKLAICISGMCVSVHVHQYVISMIKTLTQDGEEGVLSEHNQVSL